MILNLDIYGPIILPSKLHQWFLRTSSPTLFKPPWTMEVRGKVGTWHRDKRHATSQGFHINPNWIMSEIQNVLYTYIAFPKTVFSIMNKNRKMPYSSEGGKKASNPDTEITHFSKFLFVNKKYSNWVILVEFHTRRVTGLRSTTQYPSIRMNTVINRAARCPISYSQSTAKLLPLISSNLNKNCDLP